MANIITGMLVDAENGVTPKRKVVDDLDAIHEMLKCDIFTMTLRTVNGIEYDILADDEGLLKDKPRVTAVTAHGRSYKCELVGNLFFCHHDEEGRFTSLTDADIENLSKNILYFASEFGISQLILLDR